MSDFKIMDNRKRIPGAGRSTWVLILVLSISMTITNFKLLAQRQMTLGAMQNVPQLNMINPANMPDSMTWYVGVPLLSGLNAHYRNSSFTPAQLGLGKGSGPDYSQAMNFTDSLNSAYGELYIEDLAIGVNLGNNFLSLSVAERIFTSTDYPRQLIEWLGLEQEGADIPLGRTFELADWNFSATHYREIALGFGRKLFGGKLSLGGRAKLLLGQAAVQSENYNLRLWHRPEEEYNYEITGRMDILASGFDRFGAGASPFQLFGSANTGIAFDLGARLKVGKKVTLFASVNDLGKLNWKKNNSFTSLTDIAVDGEELFDRATDNLANDRERGAVAFSTELVTKVYVGGQFEIGDRHAFSVLANPRLYLGNADLNGSAAYRFRATHFLDLIASYNVFKERENSVGFGATVNLRPVQIYFATDKVQSVFNRSAQRDFHFAAGINLVFGQAKSKKVFAGTDEEDNNLLPIDPQPDNDPVIANETLPEEPEQKVDARELPPDKYFTFYGTVIDDETDEPLKAVYVDVYVIGPDERRELIHTSRYPGHTFNVPLFQSELQHEISVGGYGYARQTLSFRANSARLEHEFRMSDGLWSVDTPDSPSDTGVPQLVSEQKISPEPEPQQEEIYAVDQDPEIPPSENLAATDTGASFEIIQRTSLRSKPGPQALVMKRLAVGTNLVLLEKTDKHWWKMKLGDQIGYVKQHLLVSVQ